MKKISFAFLSLLLLITAAGGGVLLEPATALAIGGVPVSINPVLSEVSPGSDFTVAVDIGEVADLNAVQYDIHFDPLILQLDDITDGIVGGDAVPVMSNQLAPGHWRVVQSLAFETVEGTGFLSVLHFHALQSGPSPIELTDGILSSLSSGEIPSEWYNGSVMVGGPSGVQVSLNPANNEVSEGNGFTVAVDITQVAELNAVQYDINFNPAVIRLDDVTVGNVSGTAVPAMFNQIGPGHYRVVQSMGLGSVTGLGYLSVLHFHALAVGQSAIAFTGGLLSAMSGDPIPAVWIGGAVNVTGGGGEKELVSITVLPANPTVFTGNTQQFSATGTYDDSTTEDLTGSVTWTSSNPAIATISAGGLAAALSQGSTTISASKSGITGNTTMYVEAPSGVHINLNPPYNEAGLGSDFTEAVDITQVSDLNAVQYDINFNPAILRLDSVTPGDIGGTSIPAMINQIAPGQYRVVQSMGLGSVSGFGYLSVLHFHALAVGQSGITFTGGLLSAMSGNPIPATWHDGSATVVETTKQLVSIAVTPANPTIFTGNTQQFTATGTYDDSSTEDITGSVTWTSSNAAVATISAGGLATASSIEGSTTITATKGAVSGSTTLTTVKPALMSITITPDNPSIQDDGTQQFTATGTYADSTTADITGMVTWTSSNPGVAVINAAGLATALAAGTTTITAVLGGKSDTTVLTVTPSGPQLVSIAVTPASATIGVGQKQQFTANGTYDDSSTKDITGSVTWSSSNTAIATISASGQATGTGEGSAQITAAKSGITSPAATLTVQLLTSVEVNSGNPIMLGSGESIAATGIAGIPIEVKNLPDLGAGNGLAGYTFNITWDPAVVRVDLVKKSNASLDADWNTVIGTPDNVNGTVTITGYTTTYSTSDILLLYLGITAIGESGDSCPIHVGIVDFIDKNNVQIPAISIDSTVNIASVVAETSLSIGLDASSVVVVKVNIDRIKNPSDGSTALLNGGLGGFSARITLPDGGMEVLGVQGVAPYDGVTYNPATGVFSVAGVASPVQPNNTTVAQIVLKLTGSNQNNHNLNVQFESIIAAGDGSSVPAEALNTMMFRRGDANGDNTISIGDALIVAQYIVGQKTLDQLKGMNGAGVSHEVSGGDKLAIGDALFIAQYIVGQKNEFFQ